MTRDAMEDRVRRINEALGRPVAGWTRDATGKLRSNDGHLSLEAYSPGDGWTRYSVAETCGPDGGQRYFGPAWRGYRKKEFEAFLDGALAVIDALRTEMTP